MYRNSVTALAAAVLISGTAIPASGEPATSTLQQRFDAGGDALGKRDWQRAYDIYSTLESELVAKHSKSKSLPVMRLRKGRAMAGLLRPDDAEPVLVAALEALPDGAELAEDRHLSWTALAEIADYHLDYPLSVARWHQAVEATSEDFFKLDGLLKAVPMAIFVDPAAALHDLDRAQGLVDTLKLPNKEWPGLIHSYRGRTLMNMGELKAARTELAQAIKLLGGLSYGKVNLLDTAARSDAAIAALLDKHPERARELLTFAGASMAADQGFVRARDMSPPACDISGLAPTDVAVVEFSVRDDGSVIAVRPVYFSGQRSLAVEFARAVTRWSWTEAQLKDLKPFFRAQARVELRCTNRFKQPRGTDLLLPAVTRWLQQAGGIASQVPEALPDAKQLAALRAELKQRQADGGTTPIAALPTLIALVRNSVIPSKEGGAFAQQAYDLATANGAQGGVKAWFLLLRQGYDDTQWEGKSEGGYQRELTRALTDRTLVDDAEAEAALRIALFDSLNAQSRRKDGKAILEPLISSQRFVASDPFRVGARIRLADLEYAEGHLESAREHFQQSGITAQQCALVDARPVETRSGFSGADFPNEALRWGLGGWTVIEFDISPDGVPLNVRTVAAFPPFVFGANSEQNIKITRYQQTYRPGSEQGCVSNNLGVAYEIKK